VPQIPLTSQGRSRNSFEWPADRSLKDSSLASQRSDHKGINSIYDLPYLCTAVKIWSKPYAR